MKPDLVPSWTPVYLDATKANSPVTHDLYPPVDWPIQLANETLYSFMLLTAVVTNISFL